MSHCVPKGRAIVLSGFYSNTMSSEVIEESCWGLSLLCSERLVAESGDSTMPAITHQSVSILMDMTERCRNGPYEDIDKCIQNMVPTRRELLSVFRTTHIADADYDVTNSNKHYYEIRRSTLCGDND
eukprot:1891239-Ditylum_brightwellii.AAC.1